MSVEDIGARLVIEDGGALEALQALNTELDDVKKNLLEVGAAADAMAAKVSTGAKKATVSQAAVTAEAGKTETAVADAGAVGATAAGGHSDAVDEVTASTNKARKATQGLKQDLVDLGSSGVAKKSALAFGGAVAVGLESVDQYMKFNKQMTQLFTQAGIAQNRIPGLSAGALQIGKNTGESFSDIANQLYRIASASSGLKETNKQILALGQQAANVAVLFNTPSGAPTEQVARLFGSILNASQGNKLQQTGGSPAGMAALLNAAVGTGDIRGADLVGALGRGVLQSGEAVHAKLPDILSWLDLSTRLGAQPSTSGTLIAHSLQQLAGGTPQAKHAELMVGVDPSEMQNLISTKGIGAAVADLTKKALTFNPESYYPVYGKNAPGAASAEAQAQAWVLANPTALNSWFNNTASLQTRQNIDSQLFAKMFGGARQEIPFLSIAENQGLFGSIERELRAQANVGTYNKDLKGALGTPAQQMQIGLRNLQAYSIELGKDLTPSLVKFIHGVVDVAHFLSDNRSILDALVATLGGVVAVGTAAFVGGKVVKTAENLSKFTQFLGKITGVSSGASAGAQDAAATTQMEAATIQLEAARLGAGKGGLGGITGSTGSVVKGAESGAGGAIGGAEGGAAGGAASVARGLMPAAIAAAAAYLGIGVAHDYLQKHGPTKGLPGKINSDIVGGLANHGLKPGAGYLAFENVTSDLSNYISGHAGGAATRAVSNVPKDIWSWITGGQGPASNAGKPGPLTVGGINQRSLTSAKDDVAIQLAMAQYRSNQNQFGKTSPAATAAAQAVYALINGQGSHTASIRHGLDVNAGREWTDTYKLNHAAVSPLYRNGPYGEELVRRGNAGGQLQQERAAYGKWVKDDKSTGGMAAILAALKSEHTTLSADTKKGSGATSQDIAQVKGEISKGTQAQKMLESDSKNFTKTADTAKATSQMIAAMKESDSANKGLLQDINSTLKSLPASLSSAIGNIKISVNAPATTPSGALPNSTNSTSGSRK